MIDQQLRETPYREGWDAALPLVIEALKYQHEGLRPEDIYAALKAGTAHLFMCPDGMVVLRIEQNQDTGEKALLIWLAGSSSPHSIIDRYRDQIDQIGRSVNCSVITFVSTRRGFDRVLGDGWSSGSVRFFRRIDDVGRQ